MLNIRRAQERGKVEIDWLESFHSFSFGSYYDPKYMGFRNLRVINEDFIKPNAGFATHKHSDMEIITYVLAGSVKHEDSLKNQTLIEQGEIQCMTAGKGIAHSEYNPSTTEVLHLLQIWVLPNRQGLTPNYQQQSISSRNLTNQLCLIVSPDGEDNTLFINQDVKLYTSQMLPFYSLNYDIASGRYVWLQVIKGDLTINDLSIRAGDGVAISQEENLLIKTTQQESAFLLFDLN